MGKLQFSVFKVISFRSLKLEMQPYQYGINLSNVINIADLPS